MRIAAGSFVLAAVFVFAKTSFAVEADSTQDALFEKDDQGQEIDVAAAKRTGFYTTTISWKDKDYKLFVWRSAKPVGCRSKRACDGVLRRELPRAQEGLFERCHYAVSEDSGRHNRWFALRSTDGARDRFTTSYGAWSGDMYGSSGRASIRLNLTFTWLEKDAPVDLRKARCSIPITGGAYAHTCNSTSKPRCGYLPRKPWDAGA